MKQVRRPGFATVPLRQRAAAQALPIEGAPVKALGNNLIFVSIAAYRDPQLAATIADCLRKAQHPERLRFGICWQRAEEEAELPVNRDDPRFRILEVPWRASKGACWARAEIMKLWQGEAWFLQVDSHCRFALHWDARLIQAIGQTGADKPLLSTYANGFIPGRAEVLAGPPLQIIFQAFTPDGIPQLKPGPFARGLQPTRPVPARFLAAGFVFAAGDFIKDVPYDPELYFMGEEATMTVRAYTHGYDLFHPAEAVIWHDYQRYDANRHWDDHTEVNDAPTPGSELDRRSRAKVQRLLGGERVEPFGLGSTRTLADYEAYAGLSFRLRKAHPYTIRAEPPPNPEPTADWAERIYPWITKIVFERSLLPPGAFEDPALWYLSIEDNEGQEICRIDAAKTELLPLAGSEGNIALVCEFQSGTSPARWAVQPLSRSRGWLSKVQGTFTQDDIAILDDDEDESAGQDALPRAVLSVGVV